MDFWVTVWDHLKSIFGWIGKKLVAPGVAVIVVILAIVLVAMGFKELQIGGLLGKLFGKSAPKAIDLANTIPVGRVDKDGKLIPQGTPDSTGSTQAIVVPLEDNGGLFSNPDTVKFTPPGEETKEIKLPDGVKAKDVDKVIVVSQDKYIVTVTDKSGIKAETVDDLLKKYGN